MITFATTGFYLHFISDGKLGLHFADAENSCSFGEMPQWVEKLKQMNGNFACKDEDEGTEDLSASLVVEIAEKIFLWKLCIARVLFLVNFTLESNIISLSHRAMP